MNRQVFGCLLTFIFCLIATVCCKAESVRVVSGDTISYVSNKEKKEPVKTGLFFKDRQGNVYPVYKNSKGNEFVIKKSQKTGKDYRYYLPK